ncbi:MAG TPA: hypothetical protein VK921_06380 [Anditalea sp.]|nr:hypothetical protein [Anditalea sp.]
MTTKLKNLSLAAIMILAFTAISCSSDDPEFEADQELITDVTLLFTEVDETGTLTQNTFTVTATDPEGLELGTQPVIQAITGLEAGKRYRLDISLFNSIENEDITEEIVEDADDHQFFYLGSAFIGPNDFLTYEYADTDQNGNPIGLFGYVTVSPAPSTNNGQFRLVLRHDLDKNYAGISDPGFTNFVAAGGETDLDITFPVTL